MSEGHNDSDTEGPTKCLIVEDDLADLYLLQRLLARADPDIEIFHAPSAADAEFMALQVRFDLIVMDFQLGDGNALDLDLRIRETTGSNAETPAILVTGLESGALTRLADRQGFSACLDKNDLTVDLMTGALRRAFEDPPRD